MRKSLSNLRLLSLIAALLLVPPLTAADQKSSAKSAGKPAPDTTVGPFNEEFIFRAIDFIKKKRMTESRVLDLLDQRNISFKPTPETLKKFRDAGASPALIAKIQKLAPPEVVKEEPKKPVYILMVKCAPAECEAKAGRFPYQPTVGGLAQFSIEGDQTADQKVVVDLRKDGYEPHEHVVTIDGTKAAPGTNFEYAHTFKPSIETQLARGGQILKRMTDDFPQAAQHTLTGVLAFGATPPQQWKLSGQIGRKGEADLLFENNQGKYAATCSSFICSRSSKSRSPSILRGSKQEKAEQEAFLLRIAGAFLAQEYSAFAANLTANKPEARSVADPLKPLEGKQLELKNALGAYAITLDDNAHPAFIAFSPITNLTVVSKTKYVNFRKLNDGWYPSATEFVIPGDSQVIEFAAKEISSGQ